jgi:hypothetical protein
VGGAVAQPDGGRSLDVAALAPLAAVPGVVFVRLQLGGDAGTPPLPMLDPTPHVTDFADTAALMAGLDLVISVDTAAAHLAGAMGRPVWLLRRFEADWRWPDPEAQSTPWYASMRLFRQPKPGDWGTVMAQVGTALAAIT